MSDVDWTPALTVIIMFQLKLNFKFCLGDVSYEDRTPALTVVIMFQLKLNFKFFLGEIQILSG